MWLVDDLRWAWRGVVGRGWRAGLVVGLLTLAIAANTAVFTVADALVFHPFPYPEPDRIVTLKEKFADGVRLTPAQAKQRMAEWRKQPDVFSAVGGYLQKNVFVNTSGAADQVRTADITIGLLDVLGVKPQWGRSFTEGDDSGGEFAVLISVNLARKYFGAPARAVGQVLNATAGPHRVVGVMPENFAYPSAGFEMWRALDPQGPLTRNFGAIGAMARIAPGVTDDQLSRLLEQRAPAVGAALGVASYAVTVSPAMRATRADSSRTLLLVLLGAALCLLLATCANVASLELAASINRARTYAVQLALGASRWRLARVAAFEGTILIGTALVAGVVLVWLSSAVLLSILPDWLRLGGQNRVGLDLRALGYTTLVAAFAWLFAALAPVVAASRPNLLSLLRLEDRTAPVSRAGVRVRHMLTSAEVALAVMLVIGGLLYARSYRDLLSVDKGFDSTGLVELWWTVPSGHFASGADRAEAILRMTAALSSRPGVQAITSATPPPSVGDSPSQIALEVDGQPPLARSVLIGANWVDAAYFAVIRLPLRSGRLFAPADPPTDVVVGETFARRFWPAGDAVGHSFRRRPEEPWNRVVGVVGDFRASRTKMPDPSDGQVFFYVQRQAPHPATAPAGSAATAPAKPSIDTGGSYGFIAMTLRLDSPARTSGLLATARTLEPGLRVTLELVDDMYAQQSADTRLASQIVGGFSVLAFVVAIAGVYGLMAFLVSSRKREIGVRMALGASAADISRLVFGSSARLVAVGAVLGAIGAVLASRWIESAMFGVSATDPLTYVVVMSGVMLAALVATWQPARQAARVDPAGMLRGD